ncbi:hypothetical protein Plhal304r1_c057g0143831 [Plasmopara halstedii]
MLMDNHAPTVYVYLCPVQEICVVVESQIVRAKIHCCFVKSHEFLGLASYLTFLMIRNIATHLVDLPTKLTNILHLPSRSPH